MTPVRTDDESDMKGRYITVKVNVVRAATEKERVTLNARLARLRSKP